MLRFGQISVHINYLPLNAKLLYKTGICDKRLMYLISIPSFILVTCAVPEILKLSILHTCQPCDPDNGQTVFPIGLNIWGSQRPSAEISGGHFGFLRVTTKINRFTLHTHSVIPLTLHWTVNIRSSARIWDCIRWRFETFLVGELGKKVCVTMTRSQNICVSYRSFCVSAVRKWETLH